MAPSSQTLHERASKKRRQGDNRGAVEIYRKLTQLYPDDRIAWHNLASALGDLGLHHDAIDAAQSAQARGLDAAETWLVLARSTLAIGDLTASSQSYERVIERQPGHAEAHQELAQLIWMQTGDPDAAMARLVDSLRRMPNDVSLGITLATVLSQMGQKNRALSFSIELAKRAPDDLVAQRFAASQALHCKRPDVAQQIIEPVVARQPDDRAALSALAECHVALGHFQPAGALLDDLITHDKRNQFLIALRAVLWRLTDDPRYYVIYNYTEKVASYRLEPPSGWSSVRAYCEDLTAHLREKHPFERHPFNQSVKGAGSQIPDILDDDHPTLKAWPEAVTPAVRAFLEKLGHEAGSDTQIKRRLEAWSVRLAPSGHHSDHVHPAGLVSSACHLHFDGLSAAGPGGWLQFGKPGLTLPKDLDAEYYVKPEPGMINLFPSYMWHGVTPFEQGTERITIAMDVVPLEDTLDFDCPFGGGQAQFMRA